jgi:alpha-tubulin suppressor-like RCC1 family protein
MRVSRRQSLRSLTLFCALLSCGGGGSSGAPNVAVDASDGPGPGPGGYGDSPEMRMPLATGYRHTCAIVAPSADGAGSVKCWGDNLSGQLGTGDQVPSNLPKPVAGQMNDVIAVAAGDAHTCALTKSGAVRCWGRGNEGQIATADKSDATSPKEVEQLGSGVSMIAAGYAHSCAIHHGVAKCWGDNRSKQVGYETPGALESTVPLPVTGLNERITFIGGGTASSCAVTAEGKAKCWGGKLGLVPGEVTAEGAQFTMVTTGVETACGLTAAGAVMCWDLGRPMTASVVAGLDSGGVALEAGEKYWCAILNGGAVQCSGANERGQLGIGNFMTNSMGTPLQSSDATAVAGGHSHSCVRLASGNIKCWGWNAYGQLGLGTAACQPAPTELSKVTGGAKDVAIATTHGCAITNAGAVECWGRNESGQLGTGDLVSSVVPRPVMGITTGATAIAVGTSFSCAALGSGVKCWGKNSVGQLGLGSARAVENAPKDVMGLASGVSALTAGFEHACALINGAAKCWGRNYEGQLGNGRGGQENAPTDVTGLASGVTALRAGHSHTCAVVNGAAKCWGLNSNGQLGMGSASQLDFKSLPQNVVGLSVGVTGIATGKFHSCAVVNGGAKCWGANLRGQLGVQQGVGSSTAQPMPVDVTTLSAGVATIAAGAEHSCAVVNGAVQCWGTSGAYGCVLGSAGSGVSSTPRAIAELSAGVSAIFAAENLSFAQLATGAFMAWGQSQYGELGLGHGELVPEPADVEGL